MYGKCCELRCSCVYRRRLLYTDASNKRCFSWSSWGHVDCPGDLFGRNNCTRKQHTLKAVVKVSRNIELYSSFHVNYSHQTQKLLPDLQKQQRKLRRLASEIKFRLNWTADHVNVTCGLNMKTRLRYRQTPSHLLHCATQKSLRPYSLYLTVRSLTAITIFALIQKLRKFRDHLMSP